MIKRKFFYSFLITLKAFFFLPINGEIYLHITSSEAKKIGMQIWKNEGSQKIENLIVWRKDEPCLSLGVFHFIWYPAHAPTPHRYKETFPSLLEFMKHHGKPIPEGILLNKNNHCPWSSREEFLKDTTSNRKKLLQNYMLETIDLQTEFIIRRFKKSIPHIIKSINDKKKKDQIEAIIKKLVRTTAGKYILVDYLNFKGEGTNPSEQYKDHRWGLLQVLETMDPKAENLVTEFARAAVVVLEKRVANAPHEQQWLQGWKNRIATYTTFS